MKENEQKISTPIDSDMESLLVELGTALYFMDEVAGARAPRPEKLALIAKEWLDNQRSKIGELLRKNSDLMTIAYEQRDTQRLIAAISDAITGSFTGIPITTLTMLILHYGLDHYIDASGNGTDNKSKK